MVVVPGPSRLPTAQFPTGSKGIESARLARKHFVEVVDCIARSSLGGCRSPASAGHGMHPRDSRGSHFLFCIGDEQDFLWSAVQQCSDFLVACGNCLDSRLGVEETRDMRG